VGALANMGCAANAAAPNVEVTMDDYNYLPTEWRVPAGKEVSLKLINKGKLEHEWVIMKTPVAPPFADKDEPNVYWEKEAEPGETVTATFTAPDKPGEYEIVCGQTEHIEHGMTGKLVVY
jgi:plastocyanin